MTEQLYLLKTGNSSLIFNLIQIGESVVFFSISSVSMYINSVHRSLNGTVVTVPELMVGQISETVPLNNDEQTPPSHPNSDDPYRNLQLGLVQTFIFKLSRNVKISVNSAIIFSTILSIIDIITDILLLTKLWRQKQFAMASLLAIFDFIPGVLLLIHHYSSLNWSKSTESVHIDWRL